METASSEEINKGFHEDAEDLAAFEERGHEPDPLFEDVLRDLKQRAKI